MRVSYSACVLPHSFLDLRLDRREVEARALLHRRILDPRLGQLRYFLLD
jgi:hypothetical protein